MTHLRHSTSADVLLHALHLRDEWRYDEVAALCDPESVDAFFRRHIEACEPPTIDEVVEDNPDVGLDEARVLAARLAQLREDDKRALVRSLPGVSSFDEVVALEPRDFLSRWLASMDVRYDLLRRVRAAGREWRLVVRALLLREGEVMHEVPPEFADLYLDELPPR